MRGRVEGDSGYNSVDLGIVYTTCLRDIGYPIVEGLPNVDCRYVCA